MPDIREKIVTLEQAVETVRALRGRGKRVAFTNGCFDILHWGHALYLQQARSLGDFLVVAVNSDSSVRQLKGEGRPIVPENERVTLVAALGSVDLVVVFDEPDCIRLLAALAPDVWVKGGDYRLETLNQEERRVVESRGGRIALIPTTPESSTSGIIARILKSRSENEQQ